MFKKLILGFLIVAVLAVTWLNNWTLNQYLNTVWDANYRANLEVAREHQVSFCNDVVKSNRELISQLVNVAISFRDERDDLAIAYHKLYDRCLGLYQTAVEEEEYIQDLIKALKALKVPVPEACPATVAPAKIGLPDKLFPQHNLVR